MLVGGAPTSSVERFVRQRLAVIEAGDAPDPARHVPDVSAVVARTYRMAERVRALEVALAAARDDDGFSPHFAGTADPEPPPQDVDALAAALRDRRRP